MSTADDLASIPPQAPEALVTAKQFAERPSPGHPEELVRGYVRAMPRPRPRHGEVRSRVIGLLLGFLEETDLGRAFPAGVITARNPDTVRGADVAYYSFERVPRGPLPNAYLDVAPDLVIEVLSPGDRWPLVLTKVGEYLGAGVTVVIVLDDQRKQAQRFDHQGPQTALGIEDVLTIPDVLPGFNAELRRLFG